ncbi:unnamed protein product [Amoebophrya sp. A25]|nr:unnamed protein product [Amoebophrya sp. A25]|eukprot:GSA25T00014205001.1
MDEANIRAAFEAKQIALEPPHVPISLWNLKGWTKPKEPEEGEERGSDANTDQIAGVAKSPEPENRSGSFAMTGRPTSGANQMTDRKNDGQQAKKFVEGGNQEEVKLIGWPCRSSKKSRIFIIFEQLLVESYQRQCGTSSDEKEKLRGRSQNSL